jgi:hypothetical protein
VSDTRIRLVSYEDVDSWILGKLTTRLAGELRCQGVTADIGRTADPSAEINHHIIYSGWSGAPTSADTIMITHIDTAEKAEQVRRQLDIADMGICLSSDTMHKLVALGAPRRKLCFINFPSPQQGQIQRHKISVGITSRCYANGSKREYLIAQLAPRLEPGAFVFHVMGRGWDAVIHELQRHGSDVVYHGDFDGECYRSLWQQLDYYLYVGQDEGSTGFLDAMEAGVPAITTPQGFHLDLAEGITHAFNDFEDLAQVFSEIADERRRRRIAVSSLSWRDYARKHLVAWREVLNRRAGTARYPVSTEELESVGITSAEPLVAMSPLLGAMPAAPGPGGAAHRPRLLLVADEPQAELEAVWQQIIRASPRSGGMSVRHVGDSRGRKTESGKPGLEVVLLDYRDFSDTEIVSLSFDYDAVGFWNCAPARLVRRLQRRSKLNYVLRYNLLSILSRRVGDRHALGRLGRTLLFRAVHSLRMRSRAVTISVWTRGAEQGTTAEKVPRRVRQFIDQVDVVLFTCAGWEVVMNGATRYSCYVPPPGTGASWDAAFSTLFRAMQSASSREAKTAGFRLADACLSVAHRMRGKSRSRAE